MRTRRGNLGFGAISSGSISGPHVVVEPPPWLGNTAAVKIAGAALVETAETAAIKLAGAAVAENAPTSVFKIAGAVILELDYVPIFPPSRPPERRSRFRLGMAEYSNTTGTDAYLLRGAIPSFATFRSQLRDGERFRYRAVSGVKEEVGEAIFDWPGNRIIRAKAQTPKQMVEWGEGRKIIHFIEDDGIRETDPKLLIGVAEFTNSVGLDPYALQGALREYKTLRDVLPHGVRVRYRATNNAKEEIGDGTFDSGSNLLFRHLTTIPSNLITWGPGRKLLYITEIY